MKRSEDGSMTAVPLADLDPDGLLNPAVFEHAQLGFPDDNDLAEPAVLVAPVHASDISA